MTSPASPLSLTWTADMLAPVGGFGLLALFFWLVVFIRNRSGTLYFLRDLIWRSFGGKAEYDTHSPFNDMRRDLRDVELFRYEFNIPARTLDDARLAHQWMIDNRLAPTDVGRNRNYIDWSDFGAPVFKTGRFVRWKRRLLAGAGLVLVLMMLPFPLVSQSKYLMVSLKEDSPSFYLSENDIKFGVFSEQFLTAEKCGSPATREPFEDVFPADKLDTVCSFFMDPRYVEYVNQGIREQRTIMAGFTLTCMLGLMVLALKLGRMERAKKLYEAWQRQMP